MSGRRIVTEEHREVIAAMKSSGYTVPLIREHLRRCFDADVSTRTIERHLARLRGEKKRENSAITPP